MGNTILQKIKSEKTKVLAEMKKDWDKKEFPLIRSNQWWITYDAGNNDMQYSFQDGPVTLRVLMEIVKELKSNGIKEASFETRYDYFRSVRDYIEMEDYEDGEHVTVDLTPLFQ
tara:strand:+ start:4749 stop:5090 length:342 start_codon:yes stop_codon:yes gene_type:complete